MPLTGPELFEWLGLRRVRRGGVARCAGRYLDYGRPVPGYLVPDALDALVTRDLVIMAQPDPVHGLARLRITEAGQARYAELDRHQRSPRVPPPEHPHPDALTHSHAAREDGVGESPAGHRPSSAAPPDGAPPGDQPGPPELGGPPGWWSL